MQLITSYMRDISRAKQQCSNLACVQNVRLRGSQYMRAPKLVAITILLLFIVLVLEFIFSILLVFPGRLKFLGKWTVQLRRFQDICFVLCLQDLRGHMIRVSFMGSMRSMCEIQRERRCRTINHQNRHDSSSHLIFLVCQAIF
jgi:hypothetical protein